MRRASAVVAAAVCWLWFILSSFGSDLPVRLWPSVVRRRGWQSGTSVDGLVEVLATKTVQGRI
jgi:hypothetical protein